VFVFVVTPDELVGDVTVGVTQGVGGGAGLGEEVLGCARRRHFGKDVLFLVFRRRLRLHLVTLDAQELVVIGEGRQSEFFLSRGSVSAFEARSWKLIACKLAKDRVEDSFALFTAQLCRLDDRLVLSFLRK
jgi:hypothetical protein